MTAAGLVGRLRATGSLNRWDDAELRHSADRLDKAARKMIELHCSCDAGVRHNKRLDRFTLRGKEVCACREISSATIAWSSPSGTEMKWPTVEHLTASVPLPIGYEYALPTRADIPALIQAVDDWFPGLAVGNASCYLREDFYSDRVFFDELHTRDFFLMLFKHAGEWAGMLSVERDKDSQVLYGRVGTIAESHRGSGLSKCFPPLMETMGKAMGMGMVYSLATLKVPHMQVGFEKAGWQLIGIIPGFDRELVSEDEVKRVFEAIYVKVLVTERDFLRPISEGMTPTTRTLFKHLYPGQLLETEA